MPIDQILPECRYAPLLMNTTARAAWQQYLLPYYFVEKRHSSSSPAPHKQRSSRAARRLSISHARHLRYDYDMNEHRRPDFIAAVGLAGTGKSTFVERLTQRTQWPTVYFGGQVLAEVKARGLAVTPDNERHVREDLRTAMGPAAMAKLALSGVDLTAERSTPLIIDGLYSYAELTYLREQLGDRLLVVAIHSSFAKRAERLGQRPVRPLTPAEIKERDRTEVENIDKAPPIALADYHFVNDGDLGQLNDFADSIVAKTR